MPMALLCQEGQHALEKSSRPRLAQGPEPLHQASGSQQWPALGRDAWNPLGHTGFLR